MAMSAISPSWKMSPRNDTKPPTPPMKPWPNRSPNRPAPRKPPASPLQKEPPKKPPDGAKPGRGLPKFGCVVERSMDDVDGMVDVGGGAEYVRVPRLPRLVPLPTRASALEATKPVVAATIATTARAR